MLDTSELREQLSSIEINIHMIRESNPDMTDDDMLNVFESAIDEALIGFELMKDVLDGGLPNGIDEEAAKIIIYEFNDQLLEFEPEQYAKSINLIYKDCLECDRRIGVPVSTMLLDKTLRSLLSLFAGRYPSHYYAVKDSLDFLM